MRNYNTIEYLGIWEQLNNPDFNPLEFEGYLKEAGSNAFTLSPQKWQKTTNAVGLFVKLGRYGGTYAHKDYQRLKEDENSKLSLTWNLHREISKINYKIHTDEQLSFKNEDTIKNKIYYIRNQKVMLNFELAEIYGYTTTRFNEQVKNNSEKFDDDFMFQLTKSEFENLISKKSISSWGGRRKLPYAYDCIKGRACSYTEQGFNTNV